MSRSRDAVAGVALVAGAVAVNVGFEAVPSEAFTGERRQRYAQIAEEQTAWVVGNCVAIAGMCVAFAALVLVGHGWRRAGVRGASAALGLLAVSLLGALGELAARLTVVLDRAEEVAAGGPAPEAYLDRLGIGELSAGLLVFKVAGAVGVVLYGRAAGRAGLLGPRTARAFAVVGALLFLTIPLAPYTLLLAPLGVLLCARAVRAPAEEPAALVPEARRAGAAERTRSRRLSAR